METKLKLAEGIDAFEAQLSDQGQKSKEYRAGANKIVKLLANRLGPDYSKAEVLELAKHILMLSHKYDFPPSFVLSIIEVESQFRHDAISHRGAIGLMQLRASTAEAMAAKLGLPWEGEKSLHDPKLNLEMALSYFQELRDRFKTAQHYVIAYNQGPGRLNRMIRSGEPLPKTYYNKVYNSYSSYRGAY